MSCRSNVHVFLFRFFASVRDIQKLVDRVFDSTFSIVPYLRTFSLHPLAPYRRLLSRFPSIVHNWHIVYVTNDLFVGYSCPSSLEKVLDELLSEFRCSEKSRQSSMSWCSVWCYSPRVSAGANHERLQEFY